MNTYHPKALLAVLLCIAALPAAAADYYWKAAAYGNNYNNGENWTLGSPSGATASQGPSLDDNVFFPATSNYTTIIGGGAAIKARNITTTEGGAAFTLTGDVINIAGSVKAYGNLKLKYSVNFVNTPTEAVDATIDMGGDDFSFTKLFGFGQSDKAGKAYASIVVNKPGATLTLAHDLTATDGNLIGFYMESGGTLDLGGHTLTVGASSFTSGTLRTGTGGTLRIVPATTSNTYLPKLGGMAYEAQGGTLEVLAPTVKFAAGSVSFDTIRVKRDGAVLFNFFGVGTQSLNAASVFEVDAPALNLVNNVDVNTRFGAITAGTLHIKRKTSIVIDNSTATKPPMAIKLGNIVVDPNGCTEQSILQAKTPTTLNATAPISCSNLEFVNVQSVGQAVSAPKTDDGGNNTGFVWTEVAPKDYYWIGGSGVWSDPAHWSLSSGGTSDGCIPTGNDNVHVDAASFSATGQAITLDGSAACRDIVWNDPAMEGSLKTGNGNYAIAINGSADFSGVAENGVKPSLYFYGNGTHTIKSREDGSNTYSSPCIVFDNTGTYTLANDLSAWKTAEQSGSGALLQQIGGTFSAGGHSVKVGRLLSQSLDTATDRRTLNLAGSEICTYYAETRTDAVNTYLDHNGLDSYDFSNSHFHLDAPGTTPAYSVYTTVQNWMFHDITFESSVGEGRFFGGYYDANKVWMKGNGAVNAKLTLNDWQLTAGKIYKASISDANTTVIRRSFDSGTSGCQEITFTGLKMKTEIADFSAPGAILTNVKIPAGSTPLTVDGGQNKGGNSTIGSTIIIIEKQPATYYWVGGSGNIHDPAHWSVGVSGGDPAETNPTGCVPGEKDDVFFDGNSFSAAGQTVKLDGTYFTVRNMTWTDGVNQYKPTLVRSNQAAGYILYVAKSLELAKDMILDNKSGAGNMVGINVILYSKDETLQTLNTHGNASSGYVAFSFTEDGNYELLSDVKCYKLKVSKGDFKTNGHDITAYNPSNKYTGVDITQATAANIIDLGTSTITGAPLRFEVKDCSKWTSGQAVLKDYNGNAYTHNIATPCEVRFKSYTGYTAALSQSGTGKAVFEKMDFNSRTTNLTGKITTDTLNLNYIGQSTLSLTNEAVLTIVDKVFSHATRCAPSTLQAGTGNGTATATIKTEGGPIQLNYFDVKYVKSGNEGDSSMVRVLGRDLDGAFANNMSFTAPSSSKTLTPATLEAGEEFQPDFGIATADIAHVVWTLTNKNGEEVPAGQGSHDANPAEVPADGDMSVKLGQKGVYTYSISVEMEGVACNIVAIQQVTILPPNMWVGGTSTDFNDPSNWTLGRVPEAGKDIVFATAANNTFISADIPSGAAQRDCVLPTEEQSINIGRLENESAKALVVPAGVCLSVQGEVKGYGTPADAGKLVIKTDLSKAKPGGGFVVNSYLDEDGNEVEPCSQKVFATVEMPGFGSFGRVQTWTDNIAGSPTEGQTMKDDGYRWQHIAIPFREMSASQFKGGALQEYSEAANHPSRYYRKWGHVSKGAALSPFRTYQLTQPSPKAYSLTGQLNLCDASVTLTRKAALVEGATGPDEEKHWGLGQNLVGNSFAAAFDFESVISENQDLFEGGYDEESNPLPGVVDKTVWVYTTGSGTEWADIAGEFPALGQDSVGGNDRAGGYIAYPQYFPDGAGMPKKRIIPSMQGFLLRFTPGSTVYGADDVTLTIPYVMERNDKPLRAKAVGNEAATAGYVKAVVDGLSGRDVMWMVETPDATAGFDNGWDGRKLPESGREVAIYAPTAFGRVQVNATADLLSQPIAIDAPEGELLSLHLATYGLERYANLKLVDLQARSFVELGSAPVRYDFTASAGDNLGTRFALVDAPEVDYDALAGGVATRVANAMAEAAQRLSSRVYDAQGKLLMETGAYGETPAVGKLPAGVYVVKTADGRAHKVAR